MAGPRVAAWRCSRDRGRPAPIVPPGLGDDVAVTGASSRRARATSGSRTSRCTTSRSRSTSRSRDSSSARAGSCDPTWTGATFARLELQDVVIDGGELSGRDLREARVRAGRVRPLPDAGPGGTGAPGPRRELRDCRMDEAWLRAATLERVGFEDCALPGSDLYAAPAPRSRRFERCDLRTAELSQAAARRRARSTARRSRACTAAPRSATP